MWHIGRCIYVIESLWFGPWECIVTWLGYFLSCPNFHQMKLVYLDFRRSWNSHEFLIQFLQLITFPNICIMQIIGAWKRILHYFRKIRILSVEGLFDGKFNGTKFIDTQSVCRKYDQTTYLHKQPKYLRRFTKEPHSFGKSSMVVTTEAFVVFFFNSSERPSWWHLDNVKNIEKFKQWRIDNLRDSNNFFLWDSLYYFPFSLWVYEENCLFIFKEFYFLNGFLLNGRYFEKKRI